MSIPRLGVALIGCGRIGPNHIKALAANQELLRLVTVCDHVPDKAIRLRQQYLESTNSSDDIALATDHISAINTPGVDMVAVATDSGSHAAISIAALQAGKHVLVEKPMALDTRDAKRMIAIAEEKGLTLGVCHQNRFNPPIQLLRRALEANEFGRLLHGTIHVRWSRDDSYFHSDAWRGTYAHDGGCLMNQSVHGIDLLLWMMGEPERVSAETDTFLRPIEAEDTAVAVVRFKNGALGIIEGTTCVYPRNLEETLNIFGATGTCCIGGVAVNEVEHFVTANGEHSITSAEGRSQVDSVYGKGHTPLYQDFATAVHEGRAPYVDAYAGLRVLEMILAIYKSAAQGAPVSFPLGDYSTLEAKADYGR